MSKETYLSNPDTRDYFLSLSPAQQEALLQADVEISTLGELQLWVEHLKQS